MEELIGLLKSKGYPLSETEKELINKGDFKRDGKNLIVGIKNKLVPHIFYDIFEVEYENLSSSYIWDRKRIY